MIWQLEGENYHIQIPHLFMIYQKSFLVETRKILILEKKDNGQQFLTAAKRDSTGYKAAEQALRHNPQDAHRVYWVLTPERFCIHPMLVPLDKQNQPVTKDMKRQFENGYVVTGGYLTHTKPSKPRGLPEINPQCRLVDEGPGEPLEWFFCNGCLISKQPLFQDTAENVWDLLCENAY